jgi:signal transduction histidine kinase
MAKKPTYEELEQRVKKQGDAIDLLALAINQMGKEIRAKQEELTKQREEYQNIFELAPCYITIQDKDLKLIRYNREFASQFNAKPGDYCYHAYKGRSERCEICPVVKTFQDGRCHYSEEQGISKDGTPSFWVVRASPIKNSRGEVMAAMEMCLDVTQMKHLEKLVEDKTRELVQAERLAAVGQTVAGLAHAIKNIAAGLRGGTFVLEKGIELNNDKYLCQGWDMVKVDVDRMRKIALDLLNYAKEREPDYELCDPNTPVEEVLDLMLPRAREYGITLETDLDKSLPDAWFDPEGIHRCLLNLVTNAIDACTDMECSQREGKVVLRSLKAEGWAVAYQVEDNGCGMDEETRAKIFQRFFSTKGTKGTGLGLMITKKIIDDHGGVIEMESENGQGTRFVVKLPVKDQPPGVKVS